MNAGSVQQVPSAAVSQLGKGASASGKSGGIFGEVLAGMTKPTQAQNAQKTDGTDGIDDAAELIVNILASSDIGSLAQALEELTGASAEEIQEGLGELKASSKLSDWSEILGADVTEVIAVLGPLLEKAGVTKEQLAELSYSNDVWPLVTTVAEHASEIAARLESMLAGKDGQEVKEQAVKAVALLKTLATVMPSKDLMGWQEESIGKLNEQLAVMKDSAVLRTMLDTKPAGNAAGFQMLLKKSPQSITPFQQVPGDAVQEKNTADQPRTLVQAMAASSQSSDSSSDADGKTEQNQNQLLQNPTSQPIVSRNVFTLETPAAKPSGQAEALLEKLQGLFKQTNFGQLGGTNRLLVKLYPEHLGQVRIELVQVNGVMTARILASTALGKEMLDSQLHQLRQSFSQQNIQVDRIDVTQAVQDPSRNERNQQFSQQQFKGNEEQSEHSDSEQEEQQTFQEFLVDLEV
ncbi:hypothetical protein NCCP2716_02990 [Sporosarcina sp. NCCP-2716]|uniref:flagellar hook-length control protein FliK n=1 Tax=Sporosarcina sp. NCCP-2716 TaxID=2943679 RepID=UPI00203CB3D7|nr:flagellar hook-length control protein FliK [Sporosarcina sp. NCCP-2716]GKV67801.1 hypothetical protein NCCP2716_02990 [Sporosarcina sp. NCCP-2716]